MDLRWICYLLCLYSTAWGYIEYVEVHGCESCALRLICRDLESILVVLGAHFEPTEDDLIENKTLAESTPFPPFNPRLALNRRCSGVNYCSFILTEDCPGAESWGRGNLTVKYACVTENRVTKYCNKEIILSPPDTLGISQGFVHNPGYPRFYLGKQKCTWKIKAPFPQKVKITIFDLALISSFDEPTQCTDLVEISDSGQILYTSCSQREPPDEIVSLGDSLDVELVPSLTESLLAARGILFFYTALGCPTLPVPKDGHLVYRNDSYAEFSCCVGFVFPDTLARRRVIKCLGHKWNESVPLPDCYESTLFEEVRSSELEPRELTTFSRNMVDNNVQEVIIPTLIMLSLFVINGIILFVIYKYRHKKVAIDEEEMGPLPTDKNDLNL